MIGVGEQRLGFGRGTAIGGRYRIDEPITTGGFGRIFRAWHLGLNVPVALKVLRPERLGPEHPHAMRDFLEEARLVAQLKHAHIVGALDAGTWPTEAGQRAPYIVFEWCDGQTLRETLEAGAGPANWRIALKWMGPLVDAIAYAHERGVVHRDIKPSNIMMVPGRDGPQPRLLDFGIGKMIDAGGPAPLTTQAERRAFSFRYAAPEQLYGERTGPWTDVHALGLIMTELVVGKRAYDGGVESEIAHQILATFRPTPASFGVDVGPLEPVLQGALSLDPATRYRDGRALKRALAALARAPDDTGRLSATHTDVPVSSTIITTSEPRVPTGASGQSLAPSAATTPPPRPKRAMMAGAALVGIVAVSAAAFGLASAGSSDPPWPAAPGASELDDRALVRAAAQATHRLAESRAPASKAEREGEWSWSDWEPTGSLSSLEIEKRAVASGLVLTRYTSSVAPTFRVKGYTLVDPDVGQGMLSFYEGKTEGDIQVVAKSLEDADNSAVHVEGNTMIWIMFPEPTGSELAEALLARVISEAH